MPRVRLSGVSFRYGRSPTPALQNLELELGDGVIGIIGPNGAGKTTLFRLLLGSLAPAAGTLLINGEPPTLYRSRHPLGFLPERLAFEEYLTTGEFLLGLERLTGGMQPSDRLAQLFGGGIGDIWSARLGSLSLGQQRKVELAATLIADPDLLLLDEPTNGLDPSSVAWLRGAVLEQRRPGRTMLIASHHLDELQRVVDHLVLLNRGRVVADLARGAALAKHGSFEAFFLDTLGADASNSGVQMGRE
ncbi:MAG: ATP-binding cassette domain-containing protein [Gemmatimonadetes bacterium]|nr:ATP-binding cassette domain-containing protein [Gemmatimonadota bacterium]